MSIEMDVIERCDIVIVKEQIITPFIVDVDGTRWLRVVENAHN